MGVQTRVAYVGELTVLGVLSTSVLLDWVDLYSLEGTAVLCHCSRLSLVVNPTPARPAIVSASRRSVPQILYSSKS